MDFKVGYSPERINPDDTVGISITKIVAGRDRETPKHSVSCFSREGWYPGAPSIKVAEMARAVEKRTARREYCLHE